MPLAKITTSAEPTAEQKSALLGRLSKLLATELGKPEAYVMTAIETGAAMTFGGTDAPATYVELKSIGRFTPEQTKKLSAALCRELEAGLEVPADRTYIEFADGTGYLWGYDGETF
jgi:phenylpyruvate tautomerase PptA (4-oxalocrotonate tautomerase family)